MKQGSCLLIGIASLCQSLFGALHANFDPHWDVLGEFVYMRRQHSTSKSLVTDSDKKRYCGGCTDFSVLRTNDLINDQGFEPGFRGALIYRSDPRFSFEGSLLWVNPWSEQQERRGNHDLSFGFKDPNYIGDYMDADKAEGKYDTQFWTAEANCLRHFTPRLVDYFSLSGIAGMRYFHFNEGLNITYFKTLDKSTYDIHTKSDVFGVQMGLAVQMNPTRALTWDLMAKLGLMMDRTEQKQFLRDHDNTVTIRHLKRGQWQNGCFVDAMGSIGFQFKENLNIHAGYQFIYLSSVATAEDQISKYLSSSDGKKVDPNGVVVIHGLFAGVILSF